MAMPKQKPRGESKQDYGTPRNFIEAVEKRFGPIALDLAASADNAKAPKYFTQADDALSQDWSKLDGLLWLNPPFADIAPWAKKCAASASVRTRIILLTPASIASNWYWDHVRANAIVYAISPRLTFEGTEDPYPKDLMISVFGFGATGLGRWRWKEPE